MQFTEIDRKQDFSRFVDFTFRYAVVFYISTWLLTHHFEDYMLSPTNKLKNF